VHRRRDGRNDRQQRSLPHLLGSVGTLRIEGLDQDRLHVGHLKEGGHLVVEHRGSLVQAMAVGLGLHQNLAETHVNAPLDLALDGQAVDRAPDVVREPDVVHVNLATARIHVEIHDRGRVAVGRARPYAGTPEGPTQVRRRGVRAMCGQHAETLLGQHGGFFEGELPYLAVAHLDLGWTAAHLLARHAHQDPPHLPGRHQRRVPRHEGDAR
jgi:hypothetical protein